MTLHRPKLLKAILSKPKDSDPTQAYTGTRGEMKLGGLVERNRPAPENPVPPTTDNED